MNRRPPPRLEELNARVLPSAVPPVPAPLPAAQFARQHALAGHGLGSYVVELTPVGGGPLYQLQGTADLAALGHAHVSGRVQPVGFITEGHATGQLTFSNDKGSVTVELTGPLQHGFSALPQMFAYRVVSHTGAYARLADHGSLRLVLTAQPTSGRGWPHGTFTLWV